MKRFPYSSNDKLGSQQVSPKTSVPSPTIRLLQVCPPSKLTARNIPFTPSAMFVNITILLGLVGLTAIASSDSLPARWLTLTLGGMLVWALATLTDTEAIMDITNRMIRFLEVNIYLLLFNQ